MRSEIPRATAEYRQAMAKAYAAAARNGLGGGGLGLSFGKAISAFTGRPVGLIFCAKGDTRMEEWDPDWSGTPFMALYHATVRRIRAVGRPLAGVLWYQGESDTFDGKSYLYADRVRKLVGRLRRDTAQPDLPFFYVQIASQFGQTDEELPEWTLVQEHQRRLEPDLAPGGLCAAIDLPVNDSIHLMTSSQQRLGRRLAKVVRSRLYGDGSIQVGPRPAGVERDAQDSRRFRVRFASVNRRLLPQDRVAGFWIGPPGQRNLVCAARVSARQPDTVEVLAWTPPPPGSSLWYGKDMTTFCNLVDEQDLAAPVFGPWPLPAV